MRGGEQVGSANKPGQRVGAARPAVSSMPKVNIFPQSFHFAKMTPMIQARAAPAASRAAPRATGGAGRAATNGSGGMGAAAQAQIEDLNNQMMEMKLTVEGLEKERDFYFGKWNIHCNALEWNT